MSKTRLTVLILLWIVLLMLIIGGLLFASAGSWGYWQAWAFCGTFFAPTLIISLLYVSRDPALIERRMKVREREKQQRVIRPFISLLYFGGFLVAGFDHRYEWSRVPAALAIAADAVVLLGYLLVFRAFQENRYAASTVEVEPGQPVISSGPYAVVRHPMYQGGLLMLLSTPLALGSYWAILLSLPLLPLLILRLLNEEAVLSRDLPGYQDYLQKVRWRLIPRVW